MFGLTYYHYYYYYYCYFFIRFTFLYSDHPCSLLVSCCPFCILLEQFGVPSKGVNRNPPGKGPNKRFILKPSSTLSYIHLNQHSFAYIIPFKWVCRQFNVSVNKLIISAA